MQKEIEYMSDQTDDWTEEIESLAKENSARILSVVLGVTVGEAADKILETAAIGSASGFRQAVAMARVLGTELHTTSLIQSHRTGDQSGVQFTDKFPTIHQWLMENPEAFGILRAGNHFFYVGCGVILAKSSYTSVIHRVTHVILLGEE